MKTIKIALFTFILSLLITTMGGNKTHAQQIKGNLKTLQGKRILTVWGNHFERGFAHGYLLADDIVSMIEEYMLGTLYDAENYNKTVRLIKIYIKVPTPFHNELNGMYEGMKEAIGESSMFSARLNRNYEPVDPLAWNLVPDIFRLKFNANSFLNTFTNNYTHGFCSSISAWGDSSFNGNTLVPRS